jgi:polyisoprenoid-binding protein YceI
MINFFLIKKKNSAFKSGIFRSKRIKSLFLSARETDSIFKIAFLLFTRKEDSNMMIQKFRLGSISFLILFFLTLFPLNGRSAEFTLDKDHSHAGFQVRHIVTKLQGEFKDLEGSFTFDEKNPASAAGKFVVKAASVNTNHEKRDTHLRSADFFDVEKFPTLSFESKKVTSAGGKKFLLNGDLTIHGVTRPVTFDMEFLGLEKSPFGDYRAGFSATTKINRKDYGIVWNKVLDSGGVLVGEEVEINMQVEAIEKLAKK